jgi:hypothetical protein
MILLDGERGLRCSLTRRGINCNWCLRPIFLIRRSYSRVNDQLAERSGFFRRPYILEPADPIDRRAAVSRLSSAIQASTAATVSKPRMVWRAPLSETIEISNPEPF